MERFFRFAPSFPVRGRRRQADPGSGGALSSNTGNGATLPFCSRMRSWKTWGTGNSPFGGGSAAYGTTISEERDGRSSGGKGSEPRRCNPRSRRGGGGGGGGGC